MQRAIWRVVCFSLGCLFLVPIFGSMLAILDIISGVENLFKIFGLIAVIVLFSYFATSFLKEGVSRDHAGVVHSMGRQTDDAES